MGRSALAASVRKLRNRLAAQRTSNDSDEQLLHAFLAKREDEAFAVLVRRYGPMVLHVCRRVLGHEQDAEDAFQATFLVLARKAACLRNATAVASFLHGTAYRIALKAKQSAARRRKHEGQAPARPVANPADELSWREVRTLVDEEVARLPEKYRSAFILCCLESVGQAEAAQRMGLKEGTLSSRLTMARKLLSRRLARRGVELTAVLTASALATPEVSAVPPMLTATTIKAALATGAGHQLAGVVSVPVAELVQGVASAMSPSKAKMATVVLLVVNLFAGAGLWACRMLALPQFSGRLAETPKPQAASAPRPSGPAVETFRYAGRVLGPDGKPVAGAKIHIHGLKIHVIEFQERTVTGEDGRFRFQVRRDEFSDGGVGPPGGRPPEGFVSVAATAEGHGGNCAWAGKAEERENLTLWLPEEEIVRGRIINLEGKGIAGVNVSAYIRSKREDENHKPLPYDSPDKAGQYSGNILPCDNLCAVTDKDGHFVLRGVSRGWLYDLYINGPTVVNAKAQLVARAQKPSVVDATGIAPPDRPPPRLPLYGSTFTYVAKPCKPIVGAVRDKESGKLLAGIEVHRPWTRDDDPQATTKTGEDGRYKLLGLPNGIHTLKVEPPRNTSYLATEVRVVADQPGFAPVTFDILLERQPTVRGRVIDETTGKPVAARVEYRSLASNPSLKSYPDLAEPKWPRNHPPSTATDSDGRFNLPVLRGRGVLLIHADDRYLPARLEQADRIAEITDKGDPELIDCAPFPAWPGDFHAYRLIDVVQAKDTHVEIRLATGITRPLVVAFPDGKAHDTTVLGFKPVANDSGDQYYPGKSLIVGLAGDEVRRLFLSTDDGRFAATVAVSGKERGPVKVSLKPTGTITGRLVNKDGKPISGASFRHYFDDGPGRAGVYIHRGYVHRAHTEMEFQRSWRTKGYRNEKIGSRMEHTDEQGRFRLPDVLPDTAFDLEVILVSPPSPKGQRFITGEVRIARATVKPGETLDLGTVQAIAGAKK